jgi:hypothetical protein
MDAVKSCTDVEPKIVVITRANFDRIKVGMTCTEVEAILGPPADYRVADTARNPGNLHFIEPDDIAPDEYERGRCDLEAPDSKSAWIGNDGIIRIRFHSGVVFREEFGGLGASEVAYPSAVFIPTVRKEQGALDSLVWRARRQWRTWFR